MSGSDVGRRVPQHTAAVEAAAAAGVGLLAYTSIARASTSTLALAAEHQATEAVLAASGLPVVLLRNDWYLELYTGQLPVYLEHGIAGAAGDGRVSAATRSDLAEAAAAVLATDGHAGAVYELGGEAFTMTELAQAVTAATGRPGGLHGHARRGLPRRSSSGRACPSRSPRSTPTPTGASPTASSRSRPTTWRGSSAAARPRWREAVAAAAADLRG